MTCARANQIPRSTPRVNKARKKSRPLSWSENRLKNCGLLEFSHSLGSFSQHTPNVFLICSEVYYPSWVGIMTMYDIPQFTRGYRNPNTGNLPTIRPFMRSTRRSRERSFFCQSTRVRPLSTNHRHRGNGVAIRRSDSRSRAAINDRRVRILRKRGA